MPPLSKTFSIIYTYYTIVFAGIMHGTDKALIEVVHRRCIMMSKIGDVVNAAQAMNDLVDGFRNAGPFITCQHIMLKGGTRLIDRIRLQLTAHSDFAKLDAVV